LTDKQFLHHSGKYGCVIQWAGILWWTSCDWVSVDQWSASWVVIQHIHFIQR